MPSAQVAAQIGACVNMANHLEAPKEGDWGRAIADDDFVQIKSVGFRTVRLPVRWSAHASATPPYAIDATFMARVERVVGLARASGLRVILNDHHYDALFIEPDANKARFTAIWKQVAAQFKDVPNDELWFELLNEPHNNIDDRNLLSILNPALAEVRATNPTRKVVIGGQFYSGINSLATLPLPAGDPNLVATFHYYDPFNFTHQGASWVSPTPPLGRTFPQAGELDQLQRDVQKARDFYTRTGIPVFLGEYGAFDVIPVAQRAGYYKAVTDAFKGASVDGCVWGYTNSFAFRTGTTWNQTLLDAIGL
ncbi:glycoside hydrolase family 5 protein [Sphingomonas sp. CJ99]